MCLAGDLAAQVDVELAQVAAGRTRILRGVGGLSGFPQSPEEGRLGSAVALVDLDFDGDDELVLGAPEVPSVPGSGNLDSAGRVYIVFGADDAGQFTSPADIDLTAPSGVTVIELVGAPGERLGSDVAAAGDVDGDGIGDVVLGAPGRQRAGFGQVGAAYVLFGDLNLDGLLTSGVTADSLAATPRAVRLLATDASGRAGTSVAADVLMDADARSEVVLGAPLASSNGRLQNGTVWVVSGSSISPNDTELDLGTLGFGAVTRVTGAADFELLGQSVAGLGRFDATLPSGGQDLVGGDDVALGAPGASPNGLFSGAVYVLRGDTAAPPALSYTSADFGGAGAAGITVFGAATGDQLGTFVGRAGDLIDPGDGNVELLAGAPFGSGVGTSDAGTMLLVAGRQGLLDPVDLDASQLVPGGNLRAVAIHGPQNSAGITGVSAAPIGDYDVDGDVDLAVGFSGHDRADIGLQVDSGVVEVIDGARLDPGVNQVIDLQIDSSGVVARFLGEATDALAGAAMAAGDHDGDGEIDLGLGAPLAPSDAGQAALSRTGRGHLVFGPIARGGAVDPPASFFGGPVVSVEVYELPPGPVTVTVDGLPANVVSTTPGTIGIVEFEPPEPITPGATVDVVIDSDLGTAVLTEVFTFIPFAFTATPVPDVVVPQLKILISADAVPSVPPLSNLQVTVGGIPAAYTQVSPENGSFLLTMPAGLAPNATYDIVVSSANGDATLRDGVEYAPFILLNVTPDDAPQETGIFAPGMGLAEEGSPPVEVVLAVPVTEGSSLSPATTVEFGREDLAVDDALAWKDAEVLSIDGVAVTVQLPDFLLGPNDEFVDIRITDGPDQIVFEDAFRYFASDYRQILEPEVESTGFGAAPPKLRLAGDFSPGANQLVQLTDMAPETMFVAFFGGLSEAIPATPFRGGLVGVDFTPPFGFIRVIPLPGLTEVSFESFLSFGLQPDGVQVYLQLVTSEFDGMGFDYGFSSVIECTLRFQ